MWVGVERGVRCVSGGGWGFYLLTDDATASVAYTLYAA